MRRPTHRLRGFPDGVSLLVFGGRAAVAPPVADADAVPVVTFAARVTYSSVGRGGQLQAAPPPHARRAGGPPADPRPHGRQGAAEELARIAIDRDTSLELPRFMAKLPIRRLRKKDDDPKTHDGIQLDFGISRRDQPTRGVMLRNESQPGLRRLGERISESTDDEDLRMPWPKTRRAPVRGGG